MSCERLARPGLACSFVLIARGVEDPVVGAGQQVGSSDGSVAVSAPGRSAASSRGVSTRRRVGPPLFLSGFFSGRLTHSLRSSRYFIG